MKKELYLFTIHYPFGTSEKSFIEGELSFHLQNFEKIYIFPNTDLTEQTSVLPERVELIKLDVFQKISFKGLNPSDFFRIFYLVLFDFFGSANFIQKIYKFNYFTGRIFLMYRNALLLHEKLKEKNSSEIVCYTYWFDEWTGSLSILKKHIKKFESLKLFSRAHRFDLYEELSDSVHFRPLRKFQLKYLNKLFLVSMDGLDYVSKKYSRHTEKYFCRHLGSFSRGTNPLNDLSTFRIISCSNLIPVKRVDLIIDSLKNIPFEVEWNHFGGGPLFSFLKNKSSELPKNIKFQFLGHLENKKIIEYYMGNQVNLFLHLSDSEGLPMAILEALSFGIPAMVKNCGGVSDAVNKQTGILLDTNLNSNEIAGEIVRFKDSFLNSMEFRKNVRKFWEKHFDANENYFQFSTEISQ